MAMKQLVLILPLNLPHSPLLGFHVSASASKPNHITASSSSNDTKPSTPPTQTRRHFSLLSLSTTTSSSSSSSSSYSSLLTACVSTILTCLSSSASPAYSSAPQFTELPNSGGVKALDFRLGSGGVPVDGDQVAIHYYGRLAAKQGWRFDSTYDHKDSTGEPIPFVFTLGSGQVISGVETTVRSMKVGGLRRVIIPPSQGYQSTSQEPLPPNFFDRQRLFTTIFNPTRLANGEGSTLGTLIFDIELVSLRRQ